MGKDGVEILGGRRMGKWQIRVIVTKFGSPRQVGEKSVKSGVGDG